MVIMVLMVMRPAPPPATAHAAAWFIGQSSGAEIMGLEVWSIGGHWASRVMEIVAICMAIKSHGEHEESPWD